MRCISYFAAFMSFFALYAPGKSQAITIPFSTYQNASYAITAGGFGSFSYDAFDPNLQGFNWQIVSARIAVTQNVTIHVNTPPNFIFIPFPLPVAYSFRYRISQDFFSTGGIFPEGFTSLSPRFKDFSGTASGAGGVTNVTKSFNYSFLFDSNSDLINGIEASGNGLFQALREDFLKTQFSDTIFGSMDLDAAKIFGLSSSVFAISGSGNLNIRYDGELLLEDGETPPAFLTASVPAVLPVPALATGFAAICLFGWRRKRQASS